MKAERKGRLLPALRAGLKLSAALGLVAAVLPVQMLVIGPLFKNKDTVPRLLARAVTRVMGLKVRLTGASVAKEDKYNGLIYFANHQSYIDPVVMMGIVPGALAGKGEVGDRPGIGTLARALDVIFLRRNGQGTWMPVKEGSLERTINAGRNIIVFPEATTSDGSSLLPLNHGVLSVMFNRPAKKEDLLMRNVRLQPFVITATHVNGEKVRDQKLRDVFAWYGDQDLGKHLWNMLKQKEIRLDVRALPPLDTAGLHSGTEVNAAAAAVLKKNLSR